MKQRMTTPTEAPTQTQGEPSQPANDIASGFQEMLFPSENNGDLQDLDGRVVLDSMMLLSEDSSLINYLDDHLYDQVEIINRPGLSETATLTFHQNVVDDETQELANFSCLPMPQLEVQSSVVTDSQVFNYSLPHQQPNEYHEMPSLSLEPSMQPEPLQYHEMQPRPTELRQQETISEQASSIRDDQPCPGTSRGTSVIPPSNPNRDSVPSSAPADDTGETDKDIDQAIANVLHDLANKSQKELMTLLEPETLERCLQDITNHPILICHHCLENFSYISMFHSHIISCSNVPKIETRMKTDQAAMDLLAMTLWKSAFIKILQGYPTGDYFMKHEAELNKELEQLWARKIEIDLNLMIKCREMFLHAAVSIITRKFVKTAIANELHRVSRGVEKSKAIKRPSTTKITPPQPNAPKLPNPAKTTNPIVTKVEEPKETIVIDDTDGEDVPPKKPKRNTRKKSIECLNTPDDVIDIIEQLEMIDAEEESKKSKKRRTSSKSNGNSESKSKKPGRKKVSETDRAIRSISVAEKTPVFVINPTVNETRRQDSSKKTPTSDRNSELANNRKRTFSDSFRLENTTLPGSLSVRTLSSGPDSPPNLSCHLTPETSVSDRGIDVTHDIDIEDMNIEELDKIGNTEINTALVEAAEKFEALEADADGNWATIKAEIEAEEDGNYESGGQYNGGHVEYDSENDYVVEKILSRRPLPGTEGSFLETDYEYLVRWEGFDETEDTWEPFEHLERCPVKMKDFHDELKRKAMRCRKGKQLN